MLANYPKHRWLDGKVAAACDGHAILGAQVQATAGDHAKFAMTGVFECVLDLAAQVFAILPLHAFAADEDQFRPADGAGFDLRFCWR